MSNRFKIFLDSVFNRKGFKEADDATGKHKKVISTLSTAYKAFGKVAKGSLKLVQGAWKTATATTRKLILGTTAAVAGSITEFQSWNKEASKAWTMMDVGKDKFYKLRKEISRLSPEMGVAKAELGRGWYQALSAGVDKDELLPFLRTAAEVSVADGTTIETAIDGITTVLNAFMMRSSEARTVADKMFNTVRDGKTTFGELASYMAHAAPTAASLGVSLEDILGSVAALTKQGTPSSTALMQIRNIMLRLNQQMEEGEVKSLGFLEALDKIARDAGYSQKALGEIFGAETVGAVFGLTGSKMDSAKQSIAKLKNSTGALATAFGKVDSETGHWAKLWQTLRAYVSDIGAQFDTKLRPLVNSFVKTFKEGLDNPKFIGIVEKISTLLQTAVVNFISGIQTALDALGNSKAQGLLAGVIKGTITMGITFLAEALLSLGSVMVALAKIFSSTLAEDFYNLKIWGQKGRAQSAAAEKIQGMNMQQQMAYGVPKRLAARGQFQDIATPEERRQYQRDIRDWASTLSQEEAAKLATYDADKKIDNAVQGVKERIGRALNKLGKAWDTTTADFQQKTGVNLQDRFDVNKAYVMDALKPGLSTNAMVKNKDRTNMIGLRDYMTKGLTNDGGASSEDTKKKIQNAEEKAKEAAKTLALAARALDDNGEAQAQFAAHILQSLERQKQEIENAKQRAKGL